MRCFQFTSIIAAFLVTGFATALQASQPAPELPQYFPTCNSPQPSAPQQALAGSSTYSSTSPVWNGQEFGVAYVDNIAGHLKFVRVYADGTPASTPVTLTTRPTTNSPSLVWNGTGYGVAWTEYNPTGAWYQIYFARLNRDGTMIGSELKVSFAGGTAETANAYDPALAWSGADYAVVWDDYRNGATTDYDIYGTLLDATGAIAGGGLSHDLVVSNAANGQYYPTIAWSAGFGLYVTVWEDNRTATKYELWGAQLRSSGTISP